MCFQDAAAEPRRPDGTARHELWEEPMLATLAPDHPLAGRDRIAIAELEGETWTAPSRSHLVYRACVAAGFEPHIAYVTRDPLTAAALVERGLAVTLMPQLIAGRLPGIVAIGLEDPAPRRSLYALLPAAGVRAAAQAFLAALRREAPDA
jgi:DNA-binding transcriptional LysR family regulator